MSSSHPRGSVAKPILQPRVSVPGHQAEGCRALGSGLWDRHAHVLIQALPPVVIALGLVWEGAGLGADAHVVTHSGSLFRVKPRRGRLSWEPLLEEGGRRG